MPKASVTFVCTECGGESLRWAGQCPHCRAWNTLQEFQVRKATKDARPRAAAPGRAIALADMEPGILLLAETDLDAICEAIAAERPNLAIVDSIQTVTDAGFEGSAGSVTQVRESAARLMRLAKDTGVPVFLVGHVTKEGSIAGPRVLEHIVDTVLYLEGDRRQELRLLRATKNRFGSADEIGVFAMGEAGLEEVPDPSAAILATVAPSSPGTVIVAT